MPMRAMPQNSCSRPDTASRSSVVAWSRRVGPVWPDLDADFERLDGPQVDIVGFTVPRGRAMSPDYGSYARLTACTEPSGPTMMSNPPPQAVEARIAYCTFPSPSPWM